MRAPNRGTRMPPHRLHARLDARLHALLLTIALLAGTIALVASDSRPAYAAPLSCAPNIIYTQNNSTGQLASVNLDTGAVANVGRVPGVQAAGWGVGVSANALGINADGSLAYGVERQYRAATLSSWVSAILVYDANANVWSKVTPSVSVDGIVTGGAVDPKTGRYVFGGPATVGGALVQQLWVYDPATRQTQVLGYVETDYPGSTNPNSVGGDIAFNAQGDLYVLLGPTTNTRVFAASSARVQAAMASSGNVSIPSTKIGEASGTSTYSGIAFAGNGDLILANGSTAWRHDPVTLQRKNNGAAVTTNLGASGDLASCTKPPSLTLQKDVEGRIAASDQFALSIASGSTNLITVTTRGSATGIQPDEAGPLVVSAGSTYTFSEARGAGSANDVTAYTSSYRCTAVDSTTGASTVVAAGQGTRGTVTVQAGTNVTCVIRNEVPRAPVTLTKSWQDAVDGDTARLTISGPSVSDAVAGSSTAPAAGTAASARAVPGSTVTLAETVTSPSGASYASAYSCSRGGTSVAVSNGSFVMPAGSGTVACTVTNTASPASVVVQKVWKIHDGKGNALGSYHLPAQPGDSGSSPPEGFTATPTVNGAAASWGEPRGGLRVGQRVQLAETGAAVPAGCRIESSQLTAVNGSALSAPAALPYTATVSATPQPNSFEITKTVSCTQRLTLVKHIDFGAADPADWTLSGTGPSGALPGPDGASGSEAASADITPGAAYTLAESGTTAATAAYTPAGGWACTDDATGQSVPVNGEQVTLAYGQSAHCGITNTTGVLTLLKEVDGDGLRPQAFELSAVPAASAGSGEQSGQAGAGSAPAHTGIAGASSATSANTVEVLPDTDYVLEERSVSADQPYLRLGLQFSRDGSSWENALSSTVRVPAGEHVYYRFVNKAVPAIALPFTGGLGVDRVLIVGAAILALTAALASAQLLRAGSRRRRRLRTDGGGG